MNHRRTFIAIAATVLTSAILAQDVATRKATSEVQQKTSQIEATKGAKKKRPGSAAVKGKQRQQYLRTLTKQLGIGEGAVIADIGAGDGRDSWVFADVVGAGGLVFAQEIDQGKVTELEKAAEQKKLEQVRPVLGKNDDPDLPSASVDMAFMHYVYHHLSQPREMLVGLWKSLKPGGYLVVVDRHRGTLQDWVPREIRAKKHHWIAETTVVREAREQGFVYSSCAEELWPADDHFVLVFERPRNATAPGSDPDQPLPLDLEQAKRQLLSTQPSFERPVIVALGPARELIAPIVQHSAGVGIDVVLEEWATQKNERPRLPARISLPTVMTDRGSLSLDDDTFDAVFFLDTYHRLFHHEKTLQALRQRLSPNARLFVLDRVSASELSRRESSHRRKISADRVKREMKAAGFRLLSQPPAPAADRMLLVFER